MHRLFIPLCCLALASCADFQMPQLSLNWARMGTSNEGQTSNCPQIQIVPELSSLTQFDDFYAGPQTQDQVQTISLLETAGAVCRKEGNILQVDLTLTFMNALGALGIEDLGKNASFAFPYFAAIADSTGAIKAKDVFATSLSFNKNTTSAQKIENLKQSITIDEGKDISDIRILIGFQLTPEQLAYNRSNPRPALSSLQIKNAVVIDDRATSPENR